MDKNELMERLDIYIKATNEKTEAEGQIKELESQIRMQVDSSYQYSFIRFFWPFLVLYPVLGTMFYLGLLYLIQAESYGDAYFCSLLGTVIYFVIAALVARKLRKVKCEKEYRAQVEMKEKIDADKKKRIEELQDEVKKQTEIIQENKDILPVSCRNIESVKKIRMLLVKGKIETIEEAVNYL